MILKTSTKNVPNKNIFKYKYNIDTIKISFKKKFEQYIARLFHLHSLSMSRVSNIIPM